MSCVLTAKTVYITTLARTLISIINLALSIIFSLVLLRYIKSTRLDEDAKRHLQMVNLLLTVLITIFIGKSLRLCRGFYRVSLHCTSSDVHSVDVVLKNLSHGFRDHFSRRWVE
jgi:hypothetical protein